MSELTAKSTKEKTEKVSVGINEHVVNLVREYMPSDLPDNVKKRLLIDLTSNKTADYSRINLTEVFAVFSCDAAQTITHWRVAKILDGINFAHRELKICKEGCGPTEVVDKVYKPLLAGKADVRTEGQWKIVIPVPGAKEGEPPFETNASLADFAYLLDIVNTNRNLGIAKQNLNTIVYKYFKGEPLTVDSLDSETGNKKTIDLRDQAINPRDNYDDIPEKMESYLQHIKDIHVQIGLQLLDSWRYTSEGHREIGGQAYAVKDIDGQGLFFIPLSGRMASEITLGDLLKGEKGGMMGQPQELGEMDEAVSGAIIRFRLADLRQRLRGGDVRNTGKTQRLGKAMVGLTLKEDALAQTEKVKEDGRIKTNIYLCGKNLEGDIIRGMHAHYDLVMTKTRGYGLTDSEAADIAFTDVFVPCIVNNENDWLTALAKTYQIGSNREGAILQNKEKFTDFVLYIHCRNIDKPGMPIEWQRFEGMANLRDYISRRIQLGHIDQPGVEKFATASEIKKNATPDKGDNEFIQESITEEQGKKIGELLRLVLQGYAESYIKKYIALGGNKATFLTILDKNKNFIPPNSTGEGQMNETFGGVVSQVLLELVKRGDSTAEELLGLLGDIYGVDFERDTDVPVEIVIAGLVGTLDNLTDTERKKIS